MTTTTDIQKFFHRLMELKDQGYEVNIDNGGDHKNYTAYYISKSFGNAEFSDCIIFYNGDTEDENTCLPQDIPVNELLEDLEKIVEKINKVFE